MKENNCMRFPTMSNMPATRNNAFLNLLLSLKHSKNIPIPPVMRNILLIDISVLARTKEYRLRISKKIISINIPKIDIIKPNSYPVLINAEAVENFCSTVASNREPGTSFPMVASKASISAVSPTTIGAMSMSKFKPDSDSTPSALVPGDASIDIMETTTEPMMFNKHAIIWSDEALLIFVKALIRMLVSMEGWGGDGGGGAG